MKVRCIEAANEPNLTLGKIYDVLSTDDSIPSGKQDYIIKGDDGKEDRFMEERFEAVSSIRAFVVPVVVLIDDQEAIDDERRDEAKGPVTLEELKNYLSDAMIVDWNVEEYGNEVGLESLNVHFEEIRELSPEETAKVLPAE